jgi:hypothetical protein
MGKYILVHGIRVAKDFTPETFGHLTTIGPVFWVSRGKIRQRHMYQVCQCSCGTIGCHKNDGSRATHRMADSSEYAIWQSMKNRCNNPNVLAFPSYGGRGIKVCDRWLGPSGFQNFFADMGPRPSKKHSLDRIDNNGDYCPENCRWATKIQQANNTRANRILEFSGKAQTLAQWAEETGLSHTAILLRLKRGWSIDKALTTPLRITKRTTKQ